MFNIFKKPKIYRKKELENYCGIIVENPKLVGNIGSLFRTCCCMGNIDFIGVIGEESYSSKDNRWDPIKSSLILPCWNFKTNKEFFERLPKNCITVGVELDNRSVELTNFQHPKRAIYVFGSEEHGLSDYTRKRCKKIIKIPSTNGLSMNLSCAGSMVIWDRYKYFNINNNE